MLIMKEDVDQGTVLAIIYTSIWSVFEPTNSSIIRLVRTKQVN